MSSVSCSAVQYSAVQYSALQCSAVQCITVQCSTVQCSAVQYSAVQEAGNGKTMHLLSWSPGSGTWVQEEEIKESVFDLDQVIRTTWHPFLEGNCLPSV